MRVIYKTNHPNITVAYFEFQISNQREKGMTILFYLILCYINIFGIKIYKYKQDTCILTRV